MWTKTKLRTKAKAKSLDCNLYTRYFVQSVCLSIYNTGYLCNKKNQLTFSKKNFSFC